MHLPTNSNSKDVKEALLHVNEGAAIFGITDFIKWMGETGAAHQACIDQIGYIQKAAQKAKRQLKARKKVNDIKIAKFQAGE